MKKPSASVKKMILRKESIRALVIGDLQHLATASSQTVKGEVVYTNPLDPQNPMPHGVTNCN